MYSFGTKLKNILMLHLNQQRPLVLIRYSLKDHELERILASTDKT